MYRFCLWAGLLTSFAVPLAAAEPLATLVACCGAENDLYQVLVANGVGVTRVSSPEDAVAAARVGGGVLILADGDSPAPRTLPAQLLDQAAEKRLRLYVELPAALPGLEIGKPRAVAFERLVVNSDFFGPDLPRLRILGINSISFLPVNVSESHLVAARWLASIGPFTGCPKRPFRFSSS